MNIACDARALVGPMTGVGTWTTHVLAGLADDPENRILLAASKPLNLPEELARDNVAVLPSPRAPWPGTLWLQHALVPVLGAVGADVLIGSLGILPRRCGIPSVLMVHDLTPRTHPGRHTLANRFCFNTYFASSLEAATAIVVGSTATRTDLVKDFPWVAEDLTLISYGVSEFFSPSGNDAEALETRRKFAGSRPYILHLGTLEPRKGVRLLIDAWDRLAEGFGDCPDLVLAGADGWGVAPILDRVRESPQRDRIHRVGYVSREHARALLRHAEVFVLASEAEGFGLPLAEAIACETPCVASDIPSLRECGGDAALFVRPNDPGALAAELARALKPDVQADLRREAAKRRRELGWEPIVCSWTDLLQKVVGEGLNVRV